MKIALVSEYLNHHMLPLSNALNRVTNKEYIFISKQELEEERKILGYHQSEKDVDFAICAYESEEKFKEAMRICSSYDAVVFGSLPMTFVKERLKNKKLTFRYAERVYKKKCPWIELPLRAIKYFFQYGRHKNLYLLCASAFTAGDYAKTGTFKNKAYKMGYFTQKKEYDLQELRDKKANDIPVILWAGRFLALKHAEHAVGVAERLVKDGYKFRMDIIGTGELETEIAEDIAKKGLKGIVNLLGAMPPEEVREHMERANIYLFTSDRNEGWGAVLNESMNSGCAVVASHEIGSVPFLIKNGENGLVYKSGDIDMLYRKVKMLMDNPEEQERLGNAAYKTIVEEWNAEVAAERILKLAECLSNKKSCDLFKSGPCSKAENICEDWFDGD